MFNEGPQAENDQPTTHANSDTNNDTSPTSPTDLLPNKNVVNNTILNNPTGVARKVGKNRCALVPCISHLIVTEIVSTTGFLPVKKLLLRK